MSRGGPTVVTAELTEQLCRAIEGGLPYSYACKLNGLAERTFYDALEHNVEFRRKILVSKGLQIKGLVHSVHQQGGAWKLLKNLGRDEFKDVVEETGKQLDEMKKLNGKNIPALVDLLTSASMIAYMELQRLQAKAQAGGLTADDTLSMSRLSKTLLEIKQQHADMVEREQAALSSMPQEQLVAETEKLLAEVKGEHEAPSQTSDDE